MKCERRKYYFRFVSFFQRWGCATLMFKLFIFTLLSYKLRVLCLRLFFSPSSKYLRSDHLIKLDTKQNSNSLWCCNFIICFLVAKKKTKQTEKLKFATYTIYNESKIFNSSLKVERIQSKSRHTAHIFSLLSLSFETINVLYIVSCKFEVIIIMPPHF